ncbi:hypothetical protein GUJ93_ZPchr0001g31375 [Zizania palustris]|uniref:DUF295 domain-containing protein n=1 Tax=Zizania palustris TaxID=103762 RepID=A0A8J5SD21_ZIZPA|nr:hypothetical protein GUJ93_ZPchr0001g31375 [Zizania palustris]
MPRRRVWQRVRARYPPWADLPGAAVWEILSRLPCEIDRVNCHRVCRSWHDAIGLEGIQLPPMTRQLPLLMQPLAEGPRFCCTLSGGASHPFPTPMDIPPAFRHARYVGSWGDSMAFLSIFDQPQGIPQQHVVFDLLELGHYKLPSIIVHDEAAPGELEQQLWTRPFSIIAATLSSQPCMSECVVGGIIELLHFPDEHRPKIAFWRLYDEVVMGYFDAPEVCWEVEDVLYYNEAFHFLTQGDHIRVGAPAFHIGGMTQVQWENRYFSPGNRAYEQYVKARYLVESRGDLLLVVRCSPYPGQPTSAFKVFRMVQPEVPANNNNVVEYKWMELPSLDGRMLFVGRGSSKSYEAAAYPGFESGIYFCDDEVVALQYPCTDCGKWTEAPPRVERCFPEQHPSNYSPQVWINP